MDELRDKFAQLIPPVAQSRRSYRNFPQIKHAFIAGVMRDSRPTANRNPPRRSVRRGLSVSTGVRLQVSNWRSASGQTTTEWLMIAGALTAVGIFLLRLLPSTIREFSEALVYSLRTIAP
jgi:hypothetical protein